MKYLKKKKKNIKIIKKNEIRSQKFEFHFNRIKKIIKKIFSLLLLLFSFNFFCYLSLNNKQEMCVCVIRINNEKRIPYSSLLLLSKL